MHTHAHTLYRSASSGFSAVVFVLGGYMLGFVYSHVLVVKVLVYVMVRQLLLHFPSLLLFFLSSALTVYVMYALYIA